METIFEELCVQIHSNSDLIYSATYSKDSYSFEKGSTYVREREQYKKLDSYRMNEIFEEEITNAFEMGLVNEGNNVEIEFKADGKRIAYAKLVFEL